MFFKHLILLIFGCLAITGCARQDSEYKLPGVYRIDIQQGNVIEQDSLNRLKPGMDKDQVRFIMGTPAVEDPFHTNRWDYVYTFTKGGKRRIQQHVTLIFEGDKLLRIEGDVVPGENKSDEELRRDTKTVEVPLATAKRRKGFFGRMIDAIPFVGDDDTPPPPVQQPDADEEEEAE